MAVEPEIPERNVVVVMRCGYRTDEGFTASIEAARLAGRHVRAIDNGGEVRMYSPLLRSSAGPIPSGPKPQKKARSKASIQKGARPVENYTL